MSGHYCGTACASIWGHSSSRSLVRPIIFKDHADARNVEAALLLKHTVQHDSDGLFITDITNSGIRLPVESIIRSLRSRCCSYAVVDGAQALDHRPLDVAAIDCDLYLAGTHKWFGAYHPLRVAFARRANSVPLPEQCVKLQCRSDCRVLGPACHVLRALSNVRNLLLMAKPSICLSLVAAAGALRWNSTIDTSQIWANRYHNVALLSDWLDAVATPHRVDPSLRSGIVLVRNGRPQLGRCCPAPVAWSSALLHRSYQSGAIRFAMPSYTFPLQFMSTVARAVHGLSADSFNPTDSRSAHYVPDLVN